MQYGRHNNIVISGIANDISDNQLEEAVFKMLAGVHLMWNTEACP